MLSTRRVEENSRCWGGASVSSAAIIAYHAAEYTLCLSLPPLPAKHIAIQEVSSNCITIGSHLPFPLFILITIPAVASNHEGQLMEGGLSYIDIGPSTGIAVTSEGIVTQQEDANVLEQQQQWENEIHDDDKTRRRKEDL